MDKNYLDKVVGQLVSETRIDYPVGIFTPFRELPFHINISDSRFFSSPTSPAPFTFHLTGVYSIREWGEIIYLWGKYVKTLRDKIEGNDGVINESNGMNKKFLNKVVDQIVSETTIDRDERKIYTPFSLSPLSFSFFPTYILTPPPFTKHCNEIYGLNIEEIEYVWNEYKHIIKDMLPY